MTCPHCGQELSKSALFCGVCGANAPETILESNPAPIPETNPEPKSNADVDNAKINYLSSPHSDSEALDLPGDSSNNSSNTESTKLAIAKDEPMTRQRRPPPERDQASHERANQFIEQATRQRAYEAAVNALVGKRAAAYQKRFQSNSIFNIWGFVFGPSWYAWRRMIGKAFLSSIICAIPIIGLIAFFYYAFTGDKHYRQRIDKHAQKLARFPIDSKEWKDYVDRHGGTSVWMVILYWFGCAVLTCLLNMLLRAL